MVSGKGEGARGSDPRRAEDLRKRARRIAEALRKLYPSAGLELEFENPFQLLVKAILAAQESDRKVNEVGRDFFRKYAKPEDIVKVPLEELERDLSSINFYRRKAKLLKKCCEVLVREFGGEVPRSVEEMVRLPGVGRKTANMVLGGAFGLPAVIVDRHVLRVSRRIGLTLSEDPDQVEMELRELIPRSEWTEFSFLLLNHGKRVCLARRPLCERCPICDLCDSCGVKL